MEEKDVRKIGERIAFHIQWFNLMWNAGRQERANESLNKALQLACDMQEGKEVVLA